MTKSAGPPHWEGRMKLPLSVSLSVKCFSVHFLSVFFHDPPLQYFHIKREGLLEQENCSTKGAVSLILINMCLSYQIRVLARPCHPCQTFSEFDALLHYQGSTN